MTRINAGIPPLILDDWRLVAELNEMPRVLDVYKERFSSGKPFNDIPKTFTLGTGHVKFFLDKGMYLFNRHKRLAEEFGRRRPNLTIPNSQVNLNSHLFLEMDYENFKLYTPSELDNSLVVARIIETINSSYKMPYYMGVMESKGFAIRRLTNFCRPYEDQQLNLDL